MILRKILATGFRYNFEGSLRLLKEVIAGGRCPFCDQKSCWRSGVGFEHEKICMECGVVWEPGIMVLLVELETDDGKTSK